MPEDRPRKSSFGRGQKPHIPYRGDTTNVAKKTGIRIQHNPDSDGFETYEAFAQQTDKLTPYHVKATKKKRGAASPEPEQEEEGDSDMDIDSPLHYIANSRQPTSPVSRVNSMTRPVARHQFDDLPSPHVRSPNKSRHSIRSAGPSRLSQRTFGSDDGPLSTTTRRTSGYEDMSLDTGFQDDLLPQHRSFTELDQDGVDDDADDGINEAPLITKPSPKGRGRRGKNTTVERAFSPEEPPSQTDVEDDILPQYNDDDQGPPADNSDTDAEEEEEPEPVPTKKAKLDKGKEKAKSKGQGKKKDIHREGVRRSQRKPIKPLEYWRNEKYVWERPTHGNFLVPHIKEVVRIPEEPKEPLGKYKRKRGRSKTAQPTDNPEQGWDEETPPNNVVLDWTTKQPIVKKITCLGKDVKTERSLNNDWQFQRIFGDDGFIAAGQLVIPPHVMKTAKTTKDNTYIFYVIQGAINLKVHEESMILCAESMFMVPRGNMYFIENIGERDARLFFTQARKSDDRGEGSVSPIKRPRSLSVAGPSKAPDSKAAGKRASTSGV